MEIITQIGSNYPGTALPVSLERPINRRKLLKWGIVSALGTPLLSRLADANSSVPQAAGMPSLGSRLKASFGAPVTLTPYMHGDSWNATWADDDNLYSIADDTLGNKDNPTNSNLAVYKISGGPPPNIKVEVVNSMSQFGKCTEVKPEDNCCWKASSLFCLDGILYLVIEPPKLVQNECEVWG